MNRANKNRGRDKPAKIAGPSVQVIVKTQLKLVKVGNYSLFPHRFSLHFSLTVECPRLK